jgi:pyruvate carboxylase
VQAGREVARNDKLLTLEAMKMQSTLYAPRDGKIAEVLTEPGQQVDAKDLLVVME